MDVEQESRSTPTDTRSRRERLLCALLLLLLVAAGTAIRVHTTLDDPNFDAEDARPLLRSDPGLLFYVTERIADAGGLPPEDFGADPRIEHPSTSDVPAMFTVGQEFVVAWAWLLSGKSAPLHICALWVMAFFASLSVLGVFGLAWELTRKSWAAALAALIFLLLLGNFRTVGFVLIREDFSMPWFSLHLWLFARAVRLKTVGAGLWAAAALLLAASTWHAMGFMLAIEAVVVLGWTLRSGQNPLAGRAAPWALGLLVFGSLAVPVLRSKGFLVSLPLLVAAGLFVAGRVEASGRLTGLPARMVAPAVVLLLGLVAGLLGLGGDYAHVIELLQAKLAHGGVLPEDPTALTFDTRLLWQGPFATSDYATFFGFFGYGGLGLLGLAVAWGVVGWLRGQEDGRWLVLLGMVAAGIVAAWLVRRTAVLPALLAPTVAACAAARLRSAQLRWAAVVVFLGYQLVYTYRGLESYQCPWYHPKARGVELAEVVRWAETNLPPGAALSSDFETGTALLAHGHFPMLVQPKYETTASRRRIEEFSDAFVHGNLLAFRGLLIANDCRYVLANRDFWGRFLYEAGVRPDPRWRPAPNTPFANFCHPDATVYENLPGFKLVFRSANVSGPGNIRIFELVE